jgi:hypothetical protein
MKKYLHSILTLFALVFLSFTTFPQCEPASAELCPDPENNGQVCPDSLVGGFVGQPYSQVATIKPPPTYDYQGIDVPLDHVQLMGVGNLPAGITWVSNAPDSIFATGNYYCVLMEGTPLVAGDYALRIVVDIYAVIFPETPPIYLKTVTDSTSLILVIQDNFGIGEPDKIPLAVSAITPNPFNGETRISFYTEKAGMLDFELFSPLGRKVFAEKMKSERGENTYILDGSAISPGSYLYVMRSGNCRASGMLVKTD